MTKLQLSAVSLIIIATAGLTIFNLSNDDTNQEVNPSTIEQSQSKISVVQDDKPPVNVAKIDRNALPVAHGVADENGKQIHADDQPRRLPPPPLSAPDSQYNKKQSDTASDHGHEKSHSSDHENSPPPPVGANK
ncbi:hypothetical protein CXF85_05790 [Colwellia sp. 75C3]|uniref:hypothetical protein n=1 Tax=Colwellia sp. 75C3 TaxID=888425 RepID=UPI000C31FB76|nr:hypothetical protein [Colwellia sp. 75C3]PKG85117.1 hypothetical protein CXF85_05790 [Colwellia sp. 75C3]